MAARIAEVTGTSVHDLMGDEDEDEEPPTVAITLNLPSDLLDAAILRALDQRERVRA